MSTRCYVTGALLLLLLSIPGHAAPAAITCLELPYGDCTTKAAAAPNTDFAQAIIEGKASLDEIKSFLFLTDRNPSQLALFLEGPAGYQAMEKAAEDARLDKQTGASPSSQGTTSLVSKGAVSQILSLAVEQGALTRSDNKSVATFSGNALGLARLIAGAQHLPYCSIFDPNCSTQNALQNASFSVSMNTQSNGSSTSTSSASNASILGGGSGSQVAGWTFRYDFYGRRTPTTAEFITAMKSLPKADVDTYAGNVYKEIAPLLQPGNGPYDSWQQTYAGKLFTVRTPEALQATILEAEAALAAMARPAISGLDSLATNLLTSMGTVFGTRDKAFESLVHRTSFSAEVDNEQPLNQPWQSTLRLIYGWRPTDSDQLTANGAATWYDSAPPEGAVRRLRDAQFALQYDLSLTKDSARVNTSISAGYYFQWMADNALLSIPSGNLAPGTSISLPGDASVLLGTKGTISIGMVGVTFNFKNGLKLPLSISYANRTDLLTGNTIRGHFGLTYDLDSFFAGSQPTSTASTSTKSN
jgi:hypothetical protein